MIRLYSELNFIFFFEIEDFEGWFLYFKLIMEGENCGEFKVLVNSKSNVEGVRVISWVIGCGYY